MLYYVLVSRKYYKGLNGNNYHSRIMLKQSQILPLTFSMELDFLFAALLLRLSADRLSDPTVVKRAAKERYILALLVSVIIFPSVNKVINTASSPEEREVSIFSIAGVCPFSITCGGK